MDLLHIDSDEFDTSLASILESRANELSSKPTEHIFAQLALDLEPIMRGLSEISQRPGVNAREAVSALKAQADVRFGLIREGRQLGVISDGSAGTSDNLAWIAQLNNAEIRGAMWQLVAKIQTLDKGPVDAGFLELGSGDPLFSGESAFDVETVTNEPETGD
ncbi:MAG: hypothetical protein MUP44_02735 [Anaerolineales bacterium]|nr:hypothetical protein [Anaerolineales bacterium]